jgi:hypothetical protein
LFIFDKIDRYFDLVKRSLLSFSANFCRNNCPKIDTIDIKMNAIIPDAERISSGINSGLVQIATSIIKQRLIIKRKKYKSFGFLKKLLKTPFKNNKLYS